MIVSNQKLLEINQSLIYLSNQKTCIWYVVSVNIIKIKQAVENASELVKRLQEKYCLKDGDNKPIIKEEQYQFDVENRKLFDENYAKWLNEPNDIEFKTSDQKEVLSEPHVPSLLTPLIGTILILE